MVATLMTDEQFEQFALSCPDERWEMWDGVPRRKPPMTMEHGDLRDLIGIEIAKQLDLREYRVRFEGGFIRRRGRSYFRPDFCIIPIALIDARRGQPDRLESYTEPLPLVGEVWSRSTARYDVNTKLVEYQALGHREIWYIHPYDRWVKTWRRQPDGTNVEAIHHGRLLSPAALPWVKLDIDALWTA